MPLFWVSLAFLCGILLARWMSIPFLGWLVPAFLAILYFIPPFRRRISSLAVLHSSWISEKLKVTSPVLFPLMLISLCLGAVRYQLNQPKIDPAFIAYYNDQPQTVIIEGVIIEAPDERDAYSNLRVLVAKLQLVGQTTFIPVHGLLLVRVPVSVSFKYGDLIQLEGKLQTPPENEDFSYRDYLANKGIYSYLPYPSRSNVIQSGMGNPLMNALYSFRLKAARLIYAFLPDPEAGLLVGILLGIQAGISPQLQEAFRLTGTSHILVISGFNITIIAGMFTFLFSRTLGRYKGAILTAIGIILYTLMVGANAAVVRAAILGLLTLLAHLVGRRQAGVNSLIFVAAIMAVISPTVLWDVSFQLSFAATLGIMLYAEPMTDWFISMAARFIPQDKADKIAGPVSEYFLLTLAAQITTYPLMVFYFKRLSLTAFIANPLILPTQPAIEILGGLSVLTGLVFKPLGQIFAWAVWPFAGYTTRMVEWLARIPHGSIALGQVALPLIVLFYAVLFIVTIARGQIKNVITRLTPAIPLAILSIAAVLSWKAALYTPDGRLHLTVLDVGTGEALLIHTPTGREVLINGGPSTLSLSDGLGRRLSPFHRSLDWLVIADIDDEDLAGVPGNLERFTPANVLWAGNSTGTRSAADLSAQIANLAIPSTMMQPGQVLDLGDGGELSVISVNAKGAVLLIEWDNFRMLLPMGVDVKALDDLQHEPALRNISALLLAESGYAPVNPPELIRQLNPQVVVLSVAAGDRTGLPSPETIQALEGYNLLRTDNNGWIQITTDGKQMWVEVEKK